MSYVITGKCLGERYATCVAVCPVDCIHPGEYQGQEFMIIDPEECIDCGACVPECPVNAIFEESDVPEQWKDYIAKNADPFKGDSNLPKSPTREKWEAERAQEGSAANLYYQKFAPKT